jgi:hypothetical protein
MGEEMATVKMEAGVEKDTKMQNTLPANTVTLSIGFRNLLLSRGGLLKMSGITRNANHLLRKEREPRDPVWCMLLVNPTTTNQTQRIE